MTGEFRRVGPWELVDELGSGGNATVYQARLVGSHDEPIALKVLDRTKIQSEPYLRFVKEIETLRALKDFPGVLPLLDSDLPAKPSQGSPAWLAMPIAIRIDKALTNSTVEEIVTAIQEIAETLARLKEEKGIAHRDIKPRNLYELDGKYLVSDFGLVAYPDDDPLTTNDKPMGPRHFIPDEMLSNPATADPHAVDVFCLAKTLWVLLTGQNYPLYGHQPAGVRNFSLVEQRPHPGANALDGLIDRMTIRDPAGRPTMEQVAKDLAAWMRLDPGTRQEIDVSDFVARFRAAAVDELDAQDEYVRQVQGFEKAKELVIKLTSPLDNALGELRAPVAIYRAEYDEEADETLRVLRTNGTLVRRWASTSHVGLSDEPGSLVLRLARAIEVWSTGQLFFLARIEIKLKRTMAGHRFYWQSPRSEDEVKSAPVGSIECEQRIQDTIAEMSEQLKVALETYIGAIEDR